MWYGVFCNIDGHFLVVRFFEVFLGLRKDFPYQVVRLRSVVSFSNLKICEALIYKVENG